MSCGGAVAPASAIQHHSACAGAGAPHLSNAALRLRPVLDAAGRDIAVKGVCWERKVLRVTLRSHPQIRLRATVTAGVPSSYTRREQNSTLFGIAPQESNNYLSPSSSTCGKHSGKYIHRLRDPGKTAHLEDGDALQVRLFPGLLQLVRRLV